jgi:hypothetical protein
MTNTIIGNHLVDITPDVRLLRVLRNSGFNNMTAMGELLDNSVDAGANRIDVHVQEQANGKVMITIVDNGKGMSESALQYALTLAKELKIGIDQLGKFGMGMKTAALSMTTQMEIFTKASHSDIYYGEFNMNKIELQGSFKTTVRQAKEEEIVYFNQRLGNSRSGTVIILKNCDRVGVKAETLANQLEEYIGKTYRVYIGRGVAFSISNTHNKGRNIEAIDPLMRQHKDTIIVRDRETYPINYSLANGNIKTTFIEVSAVVLPKAEKQGKYIDGKIVPLTINMANQGLYFLREGREVASAVSWSPVFGERHPSLNRFRLEVVVKSELDDEIKMDFQKGNVFPTSKLKEQLGDIIKNDILKEMKEIVDIQEREEKEKNKKRAGTGILPTPTGTGQKTDDETIRPANKTLQKTEGQDVGTQGETAKGHPQSTHTSGQRHVGIETRTGHETKPEGSTKVDAEQMENHSTPSYEGILEVAKKVKATLMNPETPKEIKDEMLAILGLKP